MTVWLAQAEENLQGKWGYVEWYRKKLAKQFHNIREPNIYIFYS